MLQAAVIVSDGKIAYATKRDVGSWPGIPPHIGAAIVVLYLVTFSYWAQLLHFNFSFVIHRLCFLTVALTVLTGCLGLPLSQAIGRLDIPGRADPKFFVQALLTALVIRLVLKFAAQSMLHATDMRTLTVWNFIYECIIPPLNEEPMFRGLLLTSLLAILQPRWALGIVLGALVFCAIHSVRDPEQQIAAFVLGCLLGTVFVRTRSLSDCIVLHAAWNMMIFVRLPFV